MKKIVIGLKLLGAACIVSSLSILITGCGSDSAVSKNPTAVTVPSNTTGKPTVNANTSVSAVPSVESVKPGDKFDVAIKVQNSQPSRGLQFSLSWDPAKVECISADQGDYFVNFATNNEGDLYSVPSKPAIDNAAGKFPKAVGSNTKLMMAIQGAQGPGGTFLGVTGNGDVYVLHMVAKTEGNGSVEFKLADVKLIDNSEFINDMNAAVNNGKITISP